MIAGSARPGKEDMRGGLDPLSRTESYAVEEGVCSQAEIKWVDEAARAELARAVGF